MIAVHVDVEPRFLNITILLLYRNCMAMSIQFLYKHPLQKSLFPCFGASQAGGFGGDARVEGGEEGGNFLLFFDGWQSYGQLHYYRFRNIVARAALG